MHEDLIRCFKHFELLYILSPMLHSEELEDVSLSLSLMVQITKKPESEIPIEVKSYIENNIIFAKDHMELLEKFGRYPHRNKVLGRTSTKDEEEYLNN